MHLGRVVISDTGGPQQASRLNRTASESSQPCVSTELERQSSGSRSNSDTHTALAPDVSHTSGPGIRPSINILDGSIRTYIQGSFKSFMEKGNSKVMFIYRELHEDLS